jgi:hypothetical protein
VGKMDLSRYVSFFLSSEISVASRISKFWGIVPHSTEKLGGIREK